jgi:hypothetical protein
LFGRQEKGTKQFPAFENETMRKEKVFVASFFAALLLTYESVVFSLEML